VFRIAKNACLTKRRKSMFAPTAEVSLDELRPHKDGETGKIEIADWSALPDDIAADAELRKARAAHEPADSSRDGRAGMASATRQIGVAYRIFVELLAGILVGAGLGWFLDGIFGTAPLLLVGFLLLGIAAGFVNTVRTARRMSAELDQQSGKGDS